MQYLSSLIIFQNSDNLNPILSVNEEQTDLKKLIVIFQPQTCRKITIMTNKLVPSTLRQATDR